MGKWETIDVCDALELLSPVFESEEVTPLHLFALYAFLVHNLDFSLDYVSMI